MTSWFCYHMGKPKIWHLLIIPKHIHSLRNANGILLQSIKRPIWRFKFWIWVFLKHIIWIYTIVMASMWQSEYSAQYSVHTPTHKHTHIHIHAHKQTHKHTKHTHTHARTHAHTHTHTHARTHARTHTHTHTHTIFRLQEDYTQLTTYRIMHCLRVAFTSNGYTNTNFTGFKIEITSLYKYSIIWSIQLIIIRCGIAIC